MPPSEIEKWELASLKDRVKILEKQVVAEIEERMALKHDVEWLKKRYWKAKGGRPQ